LAYPIRARDPWLDSCSFERAELIILNEFPCADVLFLTIMVGAMLLTADPF